MDNLASNAAICGEDDRPARRIREAGWRQVPWVGARKEWPPDDVILTITLSREQWDVAVGQLTVDHEVYADLGDEESLRLGRDAEHAIRRQLP
jgi:hypothetical protein